MDCNNELLITYGIGYALKKNKILWVLAIEKKIIFEKEININEEINFINELEKNIEMKNNFKFHENYIKIIENVLDDELLMIIPIIMSIEYKNKGIENHRFMDEYHKNDLMQLRLSKEGYIIKDLKLFKQYLDKNFKDINNYSKSKNQEISKYKKLILKLILTTSFGNEFALFVNQSGQAMLVKESNMIKEAQLKDEMKKSVIIHKNYNELDFLNLILMLRDWQEKNFMWDGKYTSLMFLINKDGKRDLCRDKEYGIKDFMISFLKGNRYLYFPFARYNDENILITLTDEKYFSDVKNKKIYDLRTNQYNMIDSELMKFRDDSSDELGYLLYYKNGRVYICTANYNDNDKAICLNETENLKEKMVQALNKYYIR